ncbi:trimeric intracellular cation channel family protein [Corynebacterium sp. A21]|uniref:trimeric intracellular cation channel family protein n=1 Tax=Corynebacterium sp. A21 TaxID=3457318 RepID=UPI003FD4D504
MLLSVLFVIGITAEAVTAALSAGRQRMDLFGVLAIASMTSLGGGTVRDVMLGHYPLTWVGEPRYLLAVWAAALITVSISWLMHYFRVIFLVLDAIGLSVFAVLGAQTALSMGHGLVIAVVAAVVTGVFGGVLRDIFSDRMPLVFSSEIYAMVAVVAALLYVGLLELQVEENVAIIVTLIVAFVIRLFAIYYKMGLPVFEYRGADQPIDPRVRLSYRILRKGWRTARRRSGLDNARYRLLNRQERRRERRQEQDTEWSLEVDMKNPGTGKPAKPGKPGKSEKSSDDRVQKWPREKPPEETEETGGD